MRIICDAPGQTCNRLWTYVASVAQCIAEHKRMMIIFYDWTIEDFPNLLHAPFIYYPLYHKWYLERGNGWNNYKGLTRPHSAIVDMVGSRRCQQCINGLFQQNGFPLVFAYYFEVTPYRIMSTDPYLAMYYQEQLAGSPHYHHASHPLFEQYFGITDQYRTIGYQKDGDKVAPIYEPDLMDADYKHHVFTVNKEICCSFAHYYTTFYITNPIRCNNIFFAVFAQFCHVPRRDYLQALSGFFSSSSATTKEALLERQSILNILFNKRKFFRWKQGILIHNSGLLYHFFLFLLKWNHQRKIKTLTKI